MSGMGTVLASSTKFGYPTCWIDSRRSPEVKESSAPPDAGVVVVLVVVVVVDVLVVVPVPVIPSVEVVSTAKKVVPLFIKSEKNKIMFQLSSAKSLTLFHKMGKNKIMIQLSLETLNFQYGIFNGRFKG